MGQKAGPAEQHERQQEAACADYPTITSPSLCNHQGGSSPCANVQHRCAIIRAYQVQAQTLNVKYKFSSWEFFFSRITSGAWPGFVGNIILYEKPDNQNAYCGVFHRQIDQTALV